MKAENRVEKHLYGREIAISDLKLYFNLYPILS